MPIQAQARRIAAKCGSKSVILLSLAARTWISLSRRSFACCDSSTVALLRVPLSLSLAQVQLLGAYMSHPLFCLFRYDAISFLKANVGNGSDGFLGSDFIPAAVVHDHCVRDRKDPRIALSVSRVVRITSFLAGSDLLSSQYTILRVCGIRDF